MYAKFKTAIWGFLTWLNYQSIRLFGLPCCHFALPVLWAAVVPALVKEAAWAIETEAKP